MLKLEIGPALHGRTPDGEPPKTWHTVDSHYEPTYRATWGHTPLPVPDEKYDWVHASHVLEHVAWWNVKFAVRDVCRILKPGGRFTVWVPDTAKIIKMYNEDPDGLLELEKDWGCGGQNPEKDPWVYMNARVFWGARPGEIGHNQHFHRAMFGPKSLSSILQKCGFSKTRYIERNTAVDPGHGWMECGVEAIK